MSETIVILCKLLSIAIGTDKEFSLNIKENVSWQEIYNLAQKQGVLAIAFDGLIKIFEQNKELTKSFPQSLKLQWINATYNIEKRYDYSKIVCSELVNKWAEQNIQTICLKGLAFSTYYPIPNHRECGDFDCYLFDDYAKGNAIARELGARVKDDWYKHAEILYRKVMIENHQYIVAVRNGKRNRDLHYLLDTLARNEKREVVSDTKIEIPSVMFNALFMNYHSLAHFLSEGIRIRHIMDWALFLQKEQHNLDWRRFYDICEEYGLKIFVDCITAITVKRFNLSITNPMIVYYSPYEELVFGSVVNDDMAIFSKNVGAWRKRIMIVQNIFSSQWKYRIFSRQSAFTRFLSLVWGFLTHPEEND